jgi:hypothetical protein
MTIRLQHPVPGGAARAAELCISEGGSVLGLIRPDAQSDTFRFFPGSHRHDTFSFQHRDVAELIAMVNRQSALSAVPTAPNAGASL